MDYEASGKHVLLGEAQSSAQKLQDAVGEATQRLVPLMSASGVQAPRPEDDQDSGMLVRSAAVWT